MNTKPDGFQSRIDVLQHVPFLKPILRSRITQPALTLITLFIFTLSLLTGLLGTSAGNRNFGSVFVWVVWWSLLTILLMPFVGRLWCAICPIPAPGEWLQRRAIIERRPGRLHTRHWSWPRRLKNRWLQNVGILGMVLFSVVILPQPAVSAWIMLIFVLTSVVLSLFYENRVFCRYLCPVGGFIGLYAMGAPIELRVRDPQVCAAHRTKTCITGDADSYGCPWMVYPGKLACNHDCGLCMECVKTCHEDNIAVNIRPFGSDLLVRSAHRLDEAYQALILLGCGLLYSADFLKLEPEGMANALDWGIYATVFLTVTLIVLPGLFWLLVALTKLLARQRASIGKLFVDYAYALVPLGLGTWIALSLGIIAVNGRYALNVLSDPFGWGWNLFGTANTPWTPLAPALIPFLQVGALSAGLLLAVHSAYRIAVQHSRTYRQAFLAILPLAGSMLLMTLALLRLYMG